MKSKFTLMGKEFDTYQVFLFFYILIIGIAVRVAGFPGHPAGLNQDEASIGYDTYALLKAGIDRNGCSFPVHFIAWGSGQNALYAYLSMPFVAIMGLNVVSVRMVNQVFSILSMLAVYSIFRKHYDQKLALIALTLTAISPWNIMLSRWSLESNLFPSMLILSMWAISKSLEKRGFLYLSAVLLALSMYAYGAAYLVVPVMLMALGIAYVITFVRNKKLSEQLSVREQLPIRSMIGPVIVCRSSCSCISMCLTMTPSSLGQSRSRTLTAGDWNRPPVRHSPARSRAFSSSVSSSTTACPGIPCSSMAAHL